MTDDEARLRRRQALTVGLLFVGYTGYYLCRSNLSVTLKPIIDELASRGVDPKVARERLGLVVSAGTLAYAFGKPFGGACADFLGGRRNFLGGMGGAIVCTVLFALGGGLPIFTIAWMGNRAVQSFGWVGMVKITSRWFSHSTYGTVMGILSLSYLFGDALSRLFMGWLLGQGLGWRAVFGIDAGVLAVLFAANVVLLRESPTQIGLKEPATDPANLYGAEGEGATAPNLRALLIPLLRSPSFGLVCLLSFGLTLLRETFNTWTPTYFVEGVGLGTSAAASWSAVFPLFGGVSVLLAGIAADRLGRLGRASIILVGLSLASGALALLGSGAVGAEKRLPIVLVALVAFLMIGPYSYLAGAVALDFGGKRGSATASGLIDAVGYLGGILAGFAMAKVSHTYGWHAAFRLLAVVAGLTATVAALWLLLQWRTPSPTPATTPLLPAMALPEPTSGSPP